MDEKLGLLTVTNVHPSDEGNYACVVESRGHPAVISSNAHLYVESKYILMVYIITENAQVFA